MRGLIALGLVVLPLLAAAAPLDACVPACQVGGTKFSLVPSVLVVESGANVTWTSVDHEFHTSDSHALDREKSCLSVKYDIEFDGWARFEIRDGGLHVLNKDVPQWRTCGEAAPLVDGTFLLDYRCLIHSGYMKGRVVVVPDSP